MHENAVAIVTQITGCTPQQAEAAISGLVAKGWRPPQGKTPPAEQSSRVPSGADPTQILTAHTDGACFGNPGPGGWSVVFSQNDIVLGEYSGRVAETTNNRMELTAIREALSRAPAGIALEILTDSNNAVGWLQKAWKRNDPTITALCREIDGLAATRAGSVAYRHVKAHQGSTLNERADRLAVAVIRQGG